jgi:hypothetical protein
MTTSKRMLLNDIELCISMSGFMTVPPQITVTTSSWATTVPPVSVQPECVRVLFNFQDLELRGLKPHSKRVRINRNHRVADVDQPHEQPLYAVTAHKTPPGSRTTNLAE